MTLNLSEISHKTECDRGTIDNCVYEIIQAFGKHVPDVRGVSLDFPTLGRLTSKHGKVGSVRISQYVLSMSCPDQISVLQGIS